MTPALDDRDRALLDGAEGEGARTAMQLMLRLAETLGAPRLIDIDTAHINGCFYNGQVGLDFAQRLVDRGARVAVPTTLNTGLISLESVGPTIPPDDATRARRLMELYVAMGCEPTWTCAPYWLPRRPKLGQQIAWAETNAVTFANAVLGARSERYGDFTDICAAITGRVPQSGLHVTANRRGQVVYDVSALPPRLLEHDALYHLLGYVIGSDARNRIPVLVGVPSGVSEDQLRAIASISALSGTVKMFHVVGVTPEAATLADALQGHEPERTVVLQAQDLLAARERLGSDGVGDAVRAVCFGTPHLSPAELRRLAALFAGRRVHPDIRCYASTGRYVRDRAQEDGTLELLRAAGVELVVDTCTYFAGYVDRLEGRVLTDSAKWAFYAPFRLRAGVTLASTAECVETAVSGRLVTDEALWSSAAWQAAA